MNGLKISALPRLVISWWKRLHLVDRILLIFMVILLAQAARSLFFYECASQNSDAMHTAIRTTAASIFGYFISAGFRGSDQSSASAQGEGALPADQDKTADPNTQTSLSESEVSRSNTHTKTATEPSDDSTDQRLHQQMLIVGMIGMFSLLILVIACDSMKDTTGAVAALSQLRDFVSGSVGFLIGHAGAVKNGTQ